MELNIIKEICKTSNLNELLLEYDETRQGIKNIQDKLPDVSLYEIAKLKTLTNLLNHIEAKIKYLRE